LALNQKQQKFLYAMLEEDTTDKAIERVGISASTAYKYIDNPEFKDELRKARARIMNGIILRLQRLGKEAIDALEENLSDEEATPANKNQTSKIILDYIYRSYENEGIVERVEQLEEIIKEHLDDV